MELFYRELGAGAPLVVLHGLYGASDNWIPVARRLAPYYRVLLPDQRNHGKSPHAKMHAYTAMAEDLLQLLNRLNLGRVCLFGHSMGGRVAMKFQSLYPGRVESMVIADVAPWTYYASDSRFAPIFRQHSQIARALQRIRPDGLVSRRQAFDFLHDELADEQLCSFLLKNLMRDRKTGRFAWRFNLEVLVGALDSMLSGVSLCSRSTEKVRVLFLRGERSAYIPYERVAELRNFYPESQCVRIADAGHWLHAEQPDEVVKAAVDFLKG